MSLIDALVAFAALVVAALGGGAVVRRKGYRDGVRDADEKARDETARRVARGRASVRDGDPDERVRSNNDHWN